jgi:hypothetical protein
MHLISDLHDGQKCLSLACDDDDADDDAGQKRLLHAAVKRDCLIVNKEQS